MSSSTPPGRACRECKRRLPYACYKPTTRRTCVYCLGVGYHAWKKMTMPSGFFDVCEVCGVVRRADDRNNPCRGPVKVTTRDDDVDGAT